MYVPEFFRETRVEVLQRFITEHPLATLIANAAQGLTANHVPLRSSLTDRGGSLRGHIARANALWRELPTGTEVLAIFMGADSYISPRAYPSKQAHGKVVPTWNYATVHVRGRIRFIEEAAWLRGFVEELTNAHEAHADVPWKVSDAPADYIEAMLRAIVGFEIEVTDITGKFKGSQNRALADRHGVQALLRAQGRDEAEIAELAPPG